MRLTKKLIEHLDTYYFVLELEVIWAIEDFYREKYWEKVFYSDLVYFQELAKKYIELRNLSFNN